MKLISKARLFLGRGLAFLPSRLPTGLSEFNEWCDKLIWLYGAPDNNSVRFALATIVLHAEPKNVFKPLRYWGRNLLKGMANQVVSFVIQDLKEKQRQAIEALEKQGEATAPTAGAPLDSVQDEKVS